MDSFKRFMNKYVVNPYNLLFMVVILLSTLGIIYLCCDSRQVQKAMIILFIIIVVIDVIVAAVKITPAGLAFKICVLALPLGLPFVMALRTHEWHVSVICVGIVIGALEILNIFFYAWFANRYVEDEYDTTEPGLSIVSVNYGGFNDFLSLPKRTYIAFIIKAPAKILIMALSIYVGAKAEYVDGEGYYNYWDISEPQWEYKTSQRKLFTESSLNLAGIIYLIFAGIYLALVITLLIMKFKRKKAKQ